MRFIAFVVGLLVAVTAGFVLASGAIPGVPSRDDRSTKDAATRWGDVSVGPVPADSGLRIVIAPAFTAEQRTAFEVVLDGPGRLDPRVRVDAETGRVTDDTLSAVMPDAARAVINSIRTGLGSSDAWPYVEDASGRETGRWGAIEFTEPSSNSGMLIGRGQGDCFRPQCGPSVFLQVTTTRSSMFVDAETGLRIEAELRIQPEDEEAFARFVRSIRPAPALPQTAP